VLDDSKSLLDGYPFTFKHQRSTFHLKVPFNSVVAQAFEQLLSLNDLAKRTSAPIAGSAGSLFAKRQVLETFPKKFRFARGARKRCGMYDWPIEELLNTSEAHRRGARVPAVVGYGYTKSRLGLVKDFFIITEMLQGYTDGFQWMQSKPEEIHRVIEASFELLFSLNSNGIYHMDLWAANVMISNDGTAPTYAIDLENCFAQNTECLSETLGFQFGFFYRREVYRYITEAAYDALVESALAAYAGVDPNRFEQVYKQSKHLDVGRKERRFFFGPVSSPTRPRI
jgi:hypothetical protein